MEKRFVTILAVLTSASALWADPIDLEKAKKIAAVYMSEGTVPEAVVSGVKTRNSSLSTPPLYIFNRGNDRGFVIVSGDDCMPVVLGYTEKGDFNPQELPPALLEWIEGYSTMIVKAQEVKASPLVVKRAATTKQDVAPLVTAHWSQGAPYNNLCPYLVQNGSGRAATGCVATAAAQVIYYWRKENPKKSLYNTPTYGYGDAPVTESIPGGTPLKYDLMQDYYSGSTPEDMNTAVATLMSVVGTSTWLTYGSSTSGQISNLVNTFWGQFHLHSICTYKSGHSQSEWENMIYEDLEKGWPIVYSGVSPSAGGHAVIVDGYRASDNLFHFNFGWGGQGDGYFTVNDTNGMNGFNGQQGMTHKIHPDTNLLDGNLLETDILCTRMSNTIEAEITNNGTVAYSGVYLVASKTETIPTSISSANAKNLTTIIGTGETKKVSLGYRPSGTGTYHLYLLDGNAHLLDQTTVEITEQSPKLTLESINICNGIATQGQITVDNRPTNIIYNNVYSNQAKVTLTISNEEEATNTMPLISCTLYAYDESQQTFVLQKKLSTSSQLFRNGTNTDLTFSIEELEKDKLYAIESATAYKVGSTEYDLPANTKETTLYFKLHDEDLTMRETGNQGAVLTGHWNAEKFNELAQSATCAYYDLTAVEGVNSQPEAGNPNALFYLDTNAGATGYNIIKDGICEHLRLTYGHDFKAKEDFTARRAEFNPQTSPLQWAYIAIPFNCDVPKGSMARRINKLTNTLIAEADAVCTQLQRGIPYLYKSTRDGELLTAENVEVCTTPADLSDTLKATFTSITGTEGMLKLNKETTQKFTSAGNFIIPAFSGYMTYDKNVDADAPLHYALDEAGKKLANALCEAQDIKENYEGKAPDDIWNNFMGNLNEAMACYTQYSSIDRLNEMTDLLTASANEVVSNKVYKGTPIDVTTLYIENPSFEKGRITGWTTNRTTGQLSKVLKVSTLAEYTVESDGAYVFYSYSNSGAGSVTLSQTLAGIPNGLYRLTAKIGTEEDQSVTMYADNRTATMTDDGFGIRYLTETVIDSISVENGTMEIGIRGTSSNYKADDFKLYYLGPSATSVTHTRSESEGLKVWEDKGAINLFADNNPVHVSIYGTDGKLYRQLTVKGFRQVNDLPKGIYIVNRQKVTVR